MQEFVVHWGYLALFVATALSAFALPIGSELVMVFAGALSSGKLLTSTHDHLSLGLVITVAIVGELFGSVCGYALGRFGGRPLIDKIGRYVLITHRDLDRVEAYLAHRGDRFVLIGRLIPLLRSFVSIVSGIAEMAIWRFLVFTIIGCALFCSALCSLGDALAGSWHAVVRDFSDAGYVALLLALLAIGAGIVHRVRALRAERHELAAEPGAAQALDP